MLSMKLMVFGRLTTVRKSLTNDVSGPLALEKAECR